MGKRTRIHRCAKDKDNPYKAVSRAPFDGSALSFEARGALGYILMKPDDWEINVPDLMREGGIGRDKAYKIIEELIAAGYAERIEARDRGGKFGGSDIHIFEATKGTQADADTPAPLPEKPDTVNPHTDKPDTVQPDTENQEQTNKGKETKKGSNKKKGDGASAPTTPAPKDHPAVMAYRDLHKRYPSTAQMQIISERDPPIGNWVRAIRAWAAAGFKPTNIEGMLEWAFEPQRISDRGYRNGANHATTNGHAGTHYERPPDAPFTQEEWREYRDPRADEIPY